MTIREGADRCPGVLRPYVSGDGSIVRVHAPGGRVSLTQLDGLLAVAEDLGAPFVQLTSRGNLQIRALPDPVPNSVADRLQAAGFLAHPAHERVRNVVAVPGREFDQLVDALDAGLVADPGLAQLSGRWLFVLSDDTGYGLGEPYDVAFQGDPATGGRVWVGAHSRAVRPDEIVPALVELSRTFLAVKSDDREWNVGDLPAESPLFDGLTPGERPAAGSLELGVHGDDAVVGMPLGQFSREHLRTLQGIADRVVVTPWRSLVVPGAAARVGSLTAAGFLTSSHTTWARISACPGAPHCRRTTSPTLELAARAAHEFAAVGPRIHIVGCERSCGAPRGAHVAIIDPQSLADLREQGAS